MSETRMPKADMSNVVNLTFAQLMDNIVTADRLIVLFGAQNVPEAVEELKAQRLVLVEEVQRRNAIEPPPDVTVGLKPLDMRGTVHIGG